MRSSGGGDWVMVGCLTYSGLLDMGREKKGREKKGRSVTWVEKEEEEERKRADWQWS